jgi:hypothetical protein
MASEAGLPNRGAILAGRLAGVALLVAGLVLGLSAPASPLDGGWWWRFVLYAFGPITSGMIVLVPVSRLNGESTRWVPPVAAVLFAATFAYAVFDSGNPASSRQSDVDVWVTIDFIVGRSPLLVLLLIFGTDSIKLAKGVLGFSVLTLVCGLVTALHFSSPFGGHSVWGFLGDVSRTGADAALPTMVALTILRARQDAVRTAALAGGALVLVLGFADSLWFANRIPFDGSWFFVLNMTGFFILAVLLAVAGRALPDLKQVLAVGTLAVVATIAGGVWYANLLDADKAWTFGIVSIGNLGMLVVAFLWWLAWPPVSDDAATAMPPGLVEA